RWSRLVRPPARPAPGLPAVRDPEREPHRDVQADLPAARVHRASCAAGVRSAGAARGEGAGAPGESVRAPRRRDLGVAGAAGTLREPVPAVRKRLEALDSP